MIPFLPRLLGLCNHNWAMFHMHFLDNPPALVGIYRCHHCGNIKSKEV